MPKLIVRIVDRILAYFLVVLGCVHNFIAAPMTHDGITTSALWFISAGLSLWYAGFINILRTHVATAGRLLLVLCALTNLSLLAFVVSFAWLRDDWSDPASVALLGSVAFLTVRSLMALSSPGE